MGKEGESGVERLHAAGVVCAALPHERFPRALAMAFRLASRLCPLCFSGELKFIDASDMTRLATREHDMCTDLEWDPTGRFVATVVSAWRQPVRPADGCGDRCFLRTRGRALTPSPLPARLPACVPFPSTVPGGHGLQDVDVCR